MADVSDPTLTSSYQEVLADSNETNWVVFGYDGPNKIVFRNKGSNGVEELKSELKDDEVLYGYLRVVSGDNESKRAKFVLISWCGESVGPLKRAKLSVHKASVKQIIKNYAVEVHGTKLEEITEEDILTRVKKASGADYSGYTGGN
eukprot:gene2652-3292_t